MHPGSWLNLPDFGLTEWAGDLLGQGRSSQGGSNLLPDAPHAASTQAPQPQVKGAATQNADTGANKTVLNNNGKTTTTTTTSGGNNGGGNNLQGTINNAQKSQEDAARAAAEAARQAAMRRYQADAAAAGKAKENASSSYNWLIDTLGSNKKDTLEQVNQNEQTNLDAYQKNQEETQGKYDSSRQEILSTYRDLNSQQEKILRGSGQSTSSRSQEAQLRLNTLMGRDLSNLSSQNADAMAIIGNAIAGVKQKSSDLRDGIETSTKQQLDKAALEYKQQIDAIDANLQLSENQKQDAYDQADAKLKSDTAAISSWAAGLSVQAAQAQQSLKDKLDQFITGNVSANGDLTTGLNDAQSTLSGFLDDVNNTSLTQGSQGEQVNTAVYQASNVDKSQLDKLLASGQITQEQYNQQLSAIQPTGQQSNVIAAAPAATATATAPNRNQILASAQQDPLLAAIYGRANGGFA